MPLIRHFIRSEFVVSGLLHKQVGGELSISEITVKAHRSKVMEKMKAGSLADLVKMASRLGVYTCLRLGLNLSGRDRRRPPQTLAQTNLSDTGVPGVASFRIRAAQTLTESFHAIGHRQVSYKLHVLVADLAREPQAKRPAVAHGQFIAIHPIGQKSLRVQCVGHIDAFPRVGFDREIDDVSGLREDFHGLQDLGEWHADPFGDVRPALFTLQHRDLGVRRVTLKLIDRKRGGPSDHAVDREPPISESSSLQALELVSRRL